MHPKAVAERVAELIVPVLEEERVELVDVVYRSEAGAWILRVFVDRTEGVTVDDCALISRSIEDLIEVEGVVPNAYRLEVSSPGLDRILTREKDFQRFAGKAARIETKSPVGGRRRFKGTILGCDEGIVHLEDAQGDRFAFALTDILKSRLEIDTPIGRKKPLPGRESRKKRG